MLRLFPAHNLQHWSCSRKPARLGYSGVACLVRPSNDAKVLQASAGMGAFSSKDGRQSPDDQAHTIDHEVVAEDEGRLMTLDFRRRDRI